MKKILRRSSFSFAPPRLLTVAFTLWIFGTASVLSSCGPDAERALDEDQALTEAGLVGSLGADSAGQDSTPMVVRRVWGGPDVNLWGDVSPDGQHLTFVDGDGNLAIRELGTGEVRRLTEDASWLEQWAEDGVISPDGEHVAYTWYQEEQDSYELRIVGWDGGSPRVLSRGESFQWYEVQAWFADGEQILISGSGSDETYQLAMVSVADGSVRTLKKLGSLWPVAVSLSPDDRYLVYDIPEGRNSAERDIFVLNMDTGEETPLGRHPANDFVLGWAPDGRHVLFASDRSGALGVWLQPVEDGRSVGDARMVKPDLWRVSPIGFAEDGSFFFGIPLDSKKVFVATLDPQTGAVLASPTPVSGDRLALEDSPLWSPDGRYLAYRSLEGQQAGWYTGEYTLSIRSVETGETRQRPVPDLKAFASHLWFPDGHYLLLNGEDKNDRKGWFKVDVQTGAAERLPAFWNMGMFPIGWSADGGSLFYIPRQGEVMVYPTGIAVLDLESGDKRVVYDQGVRRVALSPDRRSFAFAMSGGGEHSIMVIPSTGGVPRELNRFQTENDYNVSGITWSTDGRYVLYARPWDGARELWRAPVAGGPAEQLDILGILREISSEISFHPDGRRIAYETKQEGAEVWVMENFLPDQTDGGVSR